MSMENAWQSRSQNNYLMLKMDMFSVNNKKMSLPAVSLPSERKYLSIAPIDHLLP